MVGDIPLDVWFDDPLGVVAQQGTLPTNNVAVADTGTTATPVNPETPSTTVTPMPTETPVTSAVNWGEIISMPILDAEVKSTRNQLAQMLQNVGSYNTGVKDIPQLAHTLAAMAQVAERHPESALWKAQAPAMRELAVLMSNNATGPGKKSFDATLLEFEKIQGIFNGSKPELAEEPEPGVDFGDKAEMLQLMYRMQKSYNWLSSNTPTASALTDVKEKAMHEVAMLNTILHVVADPSYVVSDDEDYQGFIQQTLSHVNGMQQGLDTNNFDIFKEHIGAIYSKCSACHNSFKGN